jgi:hypothetical protein
MAKTNKTGNNREAQDQYYADEAAHAAQSEAAPTLSSENQKKLKLEAEKIRRAAMVDAESRVVRLEARLRCQEEIQRRNAEEVKKQEELRARLEDEYTMEDHSKRNLLWDMAWEHGHASGHSEVEYWYGELIALVS